MSEGALARGGAGATNDVPMEERAQGWVAAGGLFGALAASSCCILPVVLFSLGIGGTWIAHFTRLAPYKPAFLAATVTFLAAGYWLDRRSVKRACTVQTCVRPLSRWVVKGTLIAATAIAVAAAGFDYVAPYLLS